MSMWYDLSVTIEGYDISKEQVIRDAARAEWDFDTWSSENVNDKQLYQMKGEDKTFADPTERIQSIAKAIWKANGGYCKLEIQYLCLEELPWETTTMDEDDYKRLNS